MGKDLKEFPGHSLSEKTNAEQHTQYDIINVKNKKQKHNHVCVALSPLETPRAASEEGAGMGVNFFFFAIKIHE